MYPSSRTLAHSLGSASDYIAVIYKPINRILAESWLPLCGRQEDVPGNTGAGQRAGQVRQVRAGAGRGSCE